MTAPTSPNPYITKKLNNIDKAKLFKKEHDYQTKLYHKMLKGLEAMINVQRQVKNMIKIAEETNMTIMEMKETILKASINNKMMNATNILGILEDLQYLIQSNMKNWAYQVQRMLADKLDQYKGQINQYMDNNIQEIQELYKDEKQMKKLNRERIEDEEVILIKPYKESTTITKSSFIYEEIKNLR